MTDGPIVEALRAAIATVTGTNPTAGPGEISTLVAIGWATVDRDRVITELAAALAIDASAFAPAAGSTVLGSFSLVAGGVLEGAVDLAVIEPSTEGRLAAHLARHGEGPTVAWLARSAGGPAVAAGADSSGGSEGPFGPERLLPGRPDGLLRLLVTTVPGTI